MAMDNIAVEVGYDRTILKHLHLNHLIANRKTLYLFPFFFIILYFSSYHFGDNNDSIRSSILCLYLCIIIFNENNEL